ncbi:BsuBI/PstI family type II restriction endonuclease [Rhodopila globiformis]|uniref:BsuBI/PstI restriction endonuclease domain-containing protein n=1 Tax=Rhodopila globiformis TaxID=1071 RepID=A0A2S6NB26_RHOGL|nr:BsuBI/PstI family type II restriction endonuclease [Rhodopila globiformis]PPQ31818.1 hypothetical protein CCS01_16500 [Rhodopila globiformis]
MALHDRVAKIRQELIQSGRPVVPLAYQGVTKDKIRQVLGALNLGELPDLVDTVFALLDDQSDSWFARPPVGARFCDGATTAHLGCHVGILQRAVGKLDREGRDYWIKPLRELGGIQAVTLVNKEFVAGHVRAKSGNSCYKLDEGLKEILKAPQDRWRSMLAEWASQDAARVRREFQAQVVEAARKLVDNGHSNLIRASIDVYAARFLPGYQVVYIDDGDGDRISAADRDRFRHAGIELRLEDAMPDVLLWNPETDKLWVIEAVTSDGEVDLHKVTQLQRLAQRSGKPGIDFTTTYRTWRQAAVRQAAHQNIAIGTYLWIHADPSKHFLIKGFN